MSLSSDVLEQIRQELGLTTEEFCQKLDVRLDDYSTFVTADDLSNFPPAAINKLRGIMLDMEHEHVEKFKDRIPMQSHGHFAGSKILMHFDKLAQSQSDPEQVGPITVEFHPTNLCNHRCPACTFGIPERERQLTNVSFDVGLLPGLIEDLQEFQVRGIDISGGGEPLMHQDISSMITRFHEGGFDVGLVTNGSRLNDEHDGDWATEVRQTILQHCTWCRISVDAGSQAVYERMHGRTPAVSFDSLTAAIRGLGAEKVKQRSGTTLGVSFLLTPDNFLDLIKSICMFRDMPGLDYFQIKPIVIAPVERVNHPNMIFWDERLFDALVTARAYSKPAFKVYTLGFKFIDMLLNEATGLPFRKCWGHPFYPTICADGTVVVCCHMLNSLLDGNEVGSYGRITSTRRFRDVWTDPNRWQVGSNINVRLCPSNCKLSETNKVLEQIQAASPLHINFIG